MTSLGIQSAPEPSALRPMGNGKVNELLKWLVTMILAAVVSYFTTRGEMQTAIATVTEREGNHYLELNRKIDELKIDTRETMREIRDELKALRERRR
jgi:hypothetical protein